MSAGAEQPYPGLRPFTDEEEEIFFGRAEQVSQMLWRLERSRFLAVVGSSGCGKSSLVKAGLLPAIRKGFLTVPGEDMERAEGPWRFVQTRPEEAPFRALARAILRAAGRDDADGTMVALTEATLRSGPNGFFTAIADTGIDEGPTLLVVDQFEELFRLNDRAAGGGEKNRRLRAEMRAESVAFVELLLSTARHEEAGIPVLLTMRSDWIGRCDAYRGLPEAVCESQFLTPRMTRTQVREAIEGPLGVAGFEAKAEPGLVNRILNEVGTETDQLPLMQHALMQTWFAAKEEWEERGTERLLTLEAYEKVGGFSGALHQHVEEAWKELGGNERDEAIARHLFLLLCEPGRDGGQLTRRLAQVQEVAEVANTTVAKVAELVEVFRRDHRNFLVAPASEQLTGEKQIDLSHEALLRNWPALKKWIEEEEESASIYRRLADLAATEAEFLRGRDLERAKEWREKADPTAEWAERYGGRFEETMAYLQGSEDERVRVLQERTKTRRRLVIGAALLAAIIMVLLAIAAILGISGAIKNKQLLEKEKRLTRSQKFDEAGKYEANAGLAEREGERSEAWVYTLAALDLEIPENRSLPASVGRLTWTGHSPEQLERERGVPVSAIAMSADGTLLAAGAGNIVHVWSLETGELRASFSGHLRAVRGLAFSGDGAWLASGADDTTVRVWSLDDPEANRPPLRPEGEQVYSVNLSGDGRWLAAGTLDRKFEVWDSQDEFKPVHPTQGSGEGWVESVSFDSEGARLAIGYADGSFGIWDRTSDDLWTDPAGERPEAETRFSEISDDGKWLAVGGRALHVHDLQSREPSKIAGSELEGNESYSAVGLSGNGAWVAASSTTGGGAEEVIRIWDRQEGTLWREWNVKGPVIGMTLSEDGSRLAAIVGGRKGAPPDDVWQGEIKVWRPQDSEVPIAELLPPSPAAQNQWEITGTPQGKQPKITSLVRSPDGRWLVVGTSKGRLYLGNSSIPTNWSTSREAEGLDEMEITGLAVSGNGRTVVAGRQDGRVIRGTDVREERDGGANSWELEISEDSESNKPHRTSVYSIAFASEESGSLVVTGEREGNLRLWGKTPGGKLLKPGPSDLTLHCVAFVKEGSRLVAGYNDGFLRDWDLDATDGLPQEEWGVHSGAVRALRLTKDGEWLITGSTDGTVKLWPANPFRGKNPVILTGHGSGVRCLDFSLDGKWLAAGTSKGRIYLWRLNWTGRPTGELVAHWRGEREDSGGLVGVLFLADGDLCSGGQEGLRRWALGPVRAYLKSGGPDAEFHEKYERALEAAGFSWEEGTNTLVRPPVGPLRFPGGTSGKK